ncbi:MAG: MerR family transcriptional regulator [Elusimicrobiota bacterium]
MTEKLLGPGIVCRRLGIRRAVLYYKEEIGALPRARRTENGHRVYTEADLRRLRKLLAKRNINL